MDYTARLRRLAINDALLDQQLLDSRSDADGLDPKTLALVRLAALAAVGGAVPSYRAQADEAVSAGATTAEIVDVLYGVASIVGLPCVVSAAPSLAMALGYDMDESADAPLGS